MNRLSSSSSLSFRCFGLLLLSWAIVTGSWGRTAMAQSIESSTTAITQSAWQHQAFPDRLPDRPEPGEPQSLAQASSYNSSELVRIPLVNARTGETFTLEDFAGKTVVVETMATWCGACRGQMRRDAAAIAQLNSADYVVVALSIEDNLSDAELVRYADRNGFDFVFSVASLDMLLKLRSMFGRAVLNPPATPHFFISPTGELSGLSVGPISAENLADRLQRINNN